MKKIIIIVLAGLVIFFTGYKLFQISSENKNEEIYESLYNNGYELIDEKLELFGKEIVNDEEELDILYSYHVTSNALYIVYYFEIDEERYGLGIGNTAPESDFLEIEHIINSRIKSCEVSSLENIEEECEIYEQIKDYPQLQEVISIYEEESLLITP